jgi:hypothetical protein
LRRYTETKSPAWSWSIRGLPVNRAFCLQADATKG